MTAQTETAETPMTRVSRFGVATPNGDAWTVTVTQWADGWTVVDATLPDGFWGMGPHNLDELMAGDTVPTADAIVRAIEDRVEADEDTAWENLQSNYYSR